MDMVPDTSSTLVASTIKSKGRVDDNIIVHDLFFYSWMMRFCSSAFLYSYHHLFAVIYELFLQCDYTFGLAVQLLQALMKGLHVERYAKGF